jgi:flavin-binding protein dodecin
VISLTHADGVTEVPVVNGGDCGCPIPMQKKVQLIANNDNEKVGFSSNSIQEAADHALSQFRSQVGSLPLVTEVVNQYLILEFDNSRSYLVTLKRIM